MLRHHFLILVAARQNATVYLGVQCLHAAVHHLRKAGVFRNFDGRNTFVLKQLESATGGQQLYAQLYERLGEGHKACFIGDAK